MDLTSPATDSATAAPPTKKSRFFADGECKIGSPPGNITTDKGVDEEYNLHAQHKCERPSQTTRVDSDDSDTARDKGSSSIKKGTGIELPDRSVNDSHSLRLPDHDTAEPSISNNRRHGIYGAQNFGLPSNPFASASTSPSNLPALSALAASGGYQVSPLQGGLQPFRAVDHGSSGHATNPYNLGDPFQSRPATWQPANPPIGSLSALQSVSLSRQSLQDRENPAQYHPTASHSSSVPVLPAPWAASLVNSQDLPQQQSVGYGQNFNQHNQVAAYTQNAMPAVAQYGQRSNAVMPPPVQKLHPVTPYLSLPLGQSTDSGSSRGSNWGSAHITPMFSHPAVGSQIDLDRDEHGAILPYHQRRFRMPVLQVPTQVFGRGDVVNSTPPNSYTSPQRIEKTISMSSSILKRKTSDLNPPPPAYIYVRTNDPAFNVFTNGILLYPELCLALATHLPLRDLVNLYSTSRDFHTIIDSRFTTVCLAQALTKAPQSAKTFRFRSYAEYCRKDPAARLPHPDPAKAALEIPRRIPSFRWVAFVMHREKVVHELITVFAERGCPLPARCGLALTRLWMIFDVPDNARRIAMIHNHRLFTELDLYFMTCFFIKLDMMANDPLAPYQLNGLRKLLLSQRGGLDVILKVLKREMWQKQSDIIVAWVKNTMNLERLTNVELNMMGVTSVLGVPNEEVGCGKYEYWGLKGIHDDVTGQKRRYLLRPDQLVMREAIRRGLRFKPHYIRCLLYGYVRPDTLNSYEPRKYSRRIAEWDDSEYDINDNVGGLRALSVEDGGDPLLDLGDHSRGSQYTLERPGVSGQEQVLRAQQANVLERLYQISQEEQHREMNGE